MQRITVISEVIGLAASLGNIILVLCLLYFNPYGNGSNQFGTIIIVYAALFAPALFALVCLIIKKPLLLFISFVWSLPISFYLGGTPGIFKLFGLMCSLYLVSALLFYFANRQSEK